MKRKAVPQPGGEPVAELETTTDSDEPPRRASIHLGAVDRASTPGRRKHLAGDDRHAEKHEEQQQQQQQEVLGDSGTSRIQLVITGAPVSPPSPPSPVSVTPGRDADEIPERQSRRPSLDQSTGLGAATAGSVQEVMLAGGDDISPPAVFVPPRRGSVQPSISSLGTSDAAPAAADPPLLLALNAPAASSSLSLPSFRTPDVDMAAPDDDPGPLRTLFARRPPADPSRRSSVSSSRHPIAPGAHLQSQDSTPHARLAAMKMKYGDKIRDIRRISLGPSSPTAESKPTLRNRLSGFLRPKSRGSKLESRPETPIQPSKPASLSQPVHPPSGHTRFYSLDHALPNASSNLTALPRIPTPDSFRQAQNQPIVLPHTSTPTLPSPSPTPGDYFSPSSKTVYHPNRMPHNGSPERGRSASRTYVQELHLRSRSPNESAPRPEETTLPNTDETDPAIGLGRFAQNPRTSRVGDQELPWKLSIPGLGGDIDEHEEDVDYPREKARVESAGLDNSTTTNEKHHTTALDRSPSPRVSSPSPSPIPAPTAPPAISPPHDGPPTYIYSKLPPPPPPSAPRPQPSQLTSTGPQPKTICKDETCATSIICHPPAPIPIPQRKPVTTSTSTTTPTTAEKPLSNPTSAPDKPNPFPHPHRPAPPRALVSSPIELPVPATDADTDDGSDSSSEPEIVMSSTAYPGQEWRPVGYMGYE
ncbi:uncharacterized protein BO80DRAFT_19301 [Aspergillus ibericus CBS 121593]|uniref:Uncharacterized protein n=1 Tax=Aspergillus ibericus CBS 121593 TaxID=1448316 RepID=A0A395H6R0_9EURO|nr:hypothetical protein BO80DRAFT_19301 [Aspergillus ibericus CBS 121593]RAL02855.1 hypothetical protein BO80DRAFT_19301 [Aspergillus ibericus CBS 121593]